MRAGGFTLTEVVISIGLLSTVIIIAATLLGSLLRSDQKSAHLTAGALTADQVLTSRIKTIFDGLDPSLTKADFFDLDSPPEAPLEGTVRLNNSIYTYRIRYQTLVDTAGVPLGGATNQNRIKKVDAQVWWWNDDADDVRQGYGYLKTDLSRLVNEQTDF